MESQLRMEYRYQLWSVRRSAQESVRRAAQETIRRRAQEGPGGDLREYGRLLVHVDHLQIADRQPVGFTLDAPVQVGPPVQPPQNKRLLPGAHPLPTAAMLRSPVCPTADSGPRPLRRLRRVGDYGLDKIIEPPEKVLLRFCSGLPYRKRIFTINKSSS